jgi:general secretion pathway protein C
MRSMPLPTHSLWMPRLLTLGLAAAAAASVVAWVLKVQGLQTTAPVAAVAMAPVGGVDTAMVAKALGASGALAQTPAAVPVLASSRFVLVGVVASGSRGAALIAVDGKPVKPYAVGSKVGADFVLLSVQPRKAVLGRDGSGAATSDGALTLTIPAIGDKKVP